MAAQFSLCTKEQQQRLVIWVLWPEGVSGVISCQILTVQYGNRGLTQQCLQMDSRIKNGRTSVTLEEGAACPSTARNEDSIECSPDMVLLDRRVTICVVANHLQVNHGSSCEIIHDRLGLLKVSARWFSKHLILLHK
jgi:hypothetical protein